MIRSSARREWIPNLPGDEQAVMAVLSDTFNCIVSVLHCIVSVLHHSRGFSNDYSGADGDPVVSIKDPLRMFCSCT